MEMQWTALAQALVPVSDGTKSGGLVREAAAANRAWLSLMKRASKRLVVDADTAKALGSTVKGALQCFNDLFHQMKDMETEPSMDTYAWETMSESLVCLLSVWGGVRI